MSRLGDDNYDEEFPNQAALWHANAERALKGKRGRQALRDIRDALLALPEPKLIEGALCTVNPDKRTEGINDKWYLREKVENDGEGVCLIGALLWHRKVKTGMDTAEAFGSLPTLADYNHDLSETANLAVSETGMAFTLAWILACRNDETYRDKTPEERYTVFLAWIDEELAEVPA
jgi:hypothetical protein